MELVNAPISKFPIALRQYHVSAYGVVGDGTTDDTAALQSAFDAAEAAGGGVCFIPAGIYKVSNTMLIGSNVHVVGAGRGATIIRPTEPVYAGKDVNGAFIYMTLAMVGVSNASVRSLTVDHATNNHVANGIGAQPDGEGAFSTNCVIEDCELLFPPNNHSYMIWSFNAVGTKILHNYCDGASPTDIECDCPGIEVYGGSDVLVDGNTVTRAGGDGIILWTDELGSDLERVRVTNNYVSVAQNGIRIFTSADGDVKNILVANNHVTAPWVAGVKVTSNSGDVLDGLTVVGNVIDSAPTAITIFGGAASKRILVAENSISSTTDADGAGIVIADPNARISNNCIDTSAGHGIIAQTSAAVDVCNNTLASIQKIGIWFDTVTRGSILGNTVNHNAANDTNFGISCVSSSYVNINNNAIDPVNVATYAIYVNGCDACSVGAGNVIRHTTAGAAQWVFNAGTNNNRFSFTLVALSTSKTITNSLIHSTSRILLLQTAGAPLPFTLAPGGGSATMTFAAAVGDEAFDCVVL